MTKKEWAPVLAIATMMAFRMLGMFMILPVFSANTAHMPGYSPSLIGLVLGIYGLTQALFQIPFGLASDHFGRKPIIATGLILFALGSVVAALSHTLYGLLIGRALQGAGAIGSTCLALLADVTRDEKRSQAMALVGMMIGLSFAVAVIIGPLLNHYYQLAGIFWFTAGLAIAALIFLFTLVPTPPTLTAIEEIPTRLTKRYWAVLKNTQLLRLDLSIFCQHAIMTALFIALPLILSNNLQLNDHQQTLVYLFVLLAAFIITIPFIIIAEKKRQIKRTFLSAIVLITLSITLIPAAWHIRTYTTLLLLSFFTAFTILESILPSMVAKFAPLLDKGTAMGIYSSSQFLGIFVGGSLGGAIFGHLGMSALFYAIALLGLVWLLLTLTMPSPPYLSTHIHPLTQPLQTDQYWYKNLQATPGIADMAYMPHEHLLYLKIDKQIITINQLRQLLEAGNLNDVD